MYPKLVNETISSDTKVLLIPDTQKMSRDETNSCLFFDMQ